MLNKSKDKIIFLGSGKGGKTLSTQVRSTGGFVVILNSLQIHADPGPSALVSLAKNEIDASDTDLIFVSHANINHSNDLNALVYATTKGGTTKKGILISTPTVINGLRTGWPTLNPAFKDKLQDIYSIRESDEVNIQDKLLIKATKTKHEDNFNIGFIIKSPKTTIGYTSDTAYIEELKDIYKGVDILIIQAFLPEDQKSETHLNLSDAKDLITFIKPKLAILTNFSYDLIKQDPTAQARRLELQTGVQTKAAYDGMIVELI